MRLPRIPLALDGWGKAARSMKQEVHWLQTIGSSQCPQSMVKLGRRNEGGFITWNSISRNLLNLWLTVMSWNLEILLRNQEERHHFCKYRILPYRCAASQVGQYYAKAIESKFGLDFDVLFGPAYKGIPLSVAATMEISEMYGKDIRYCSTVRKWKTTEIKEFFLAARSRMGIR